MREKIQNVLEDLKQQFGDSREHLFQVELAAFNGSQAAFSGRVLQQSNRDALVDGLHGTLPGLQVDVAAVEVLRRPEARLMSVSTNLNGLHREPSWLSEQVSQLLYSVVVEILEESGNWAFVRCADGYLGWTYLPFLTAAAQPPATHLVTSPVSQLLTEPREGAGVVTRVLGGTFVHLLGVEREWAHVEANSAGWLPVEDLRDLQALPHSVAERRKQMVQDAFRMIGVHYLWGGVSANGIDCSGLAQLVHRWSGMTLRRDADMQMQDGKPVEPENLQPGDLVFFGEGDRRAVTHVGISLGGWDLIHSSRSRNGVYNDNIQKVESLRTSFLGAATYLA